MLWDLDSIVLNVHCLLWEVQSPLWDCWKSLGRRRQVLGVTFSWSPLCVKSKSKPWITLQIIVISPSSYFFFLLFCFLLLPLVTVMASGSEFLFPLDTGQLTDCLFLTQDVTFCTMWIHLWIPFPFSADTYSLTPPLPVPPQYTQMCLSVNVRYFCFDQNLVQI